MVVGVIDMDDLAAPQRPVISVVITSHDLARFDMLAEAIESVKRQHYPAVQIVVAIDHDPDLERVVRRNYPDLTVVCTDTQRGAPGARNVGVLAADGDVVAFLDDDAIARPGWLSELARLYEEHDALAAGGRLVPRWPDDGPAWWLPDEYLWLVGATHPGFNDGDREGVVRNTFGSNISFRREVFLELDGFDEAVVGRRGDRQLQAGETDLAQRLREEYDRGVRYSAAAVVEHRVDSDQLELSWLLERSYQQGVSKWVFSRRHPKGMSEETGFLRRLITRSIPQRVATALMLPVLTAAVGLGFAIAAIRGVDEDLDTEAADHDLVDPLEEPERAIELREEPRPRPEGWHTAADRLDTETSGGEHA